MNKSLKAHYDAIKAGQVTKTNIIGLRKFINRMERWGNGWSGHKLTESDANDIFDVEQSLQRVSPVVVGELHDSGLALLRSPRYKKRWDDYQRSVIDELCAFRLVRFERIGSRGQYAVPVYNAVGFNGRSFLFWNIPWQSGGNGPEIVQ